MLLYLDNSVLNRPFDDQRQPRIWLETLSFSLVLSLVEGGEANLIRSPIHDLENSRNPFPLRLKWVEKCLQLAAQNIGLADDIKKRALALEQNGIKAIDALHLACAESADANHFLTCDDRLIRRYSGQMVVQSPVTFINNLN
ncbi:MAG TPA: PIN domain-containing protein [Methylomirabilota bacterium]|nr:PIN domain-containing protein [Methylomirabilota bacterium]